jgi:hypothetical protein
MKHYVKTQPGRTREELRVIERSEFDETDFLWYDQRGHQEREPYIRLVATHTASQSSDDQIGCQQPIVVAATGNNIPLSNSRTP